MSTFPDFPDPTPMHAAPATSDLLEEIARRVKRSVEQHGAVNVSSIARAVRLELGLEHMELHALEMLVLSAAQMYSAPMEFDASASADGKSDS